MGRKEVPFTFLVSLLLFSNTDHLVSAQTGTGTIPMALFDYIQQLTRNGIINNVATNNNAPVDTNAVDTTGPVSAINPTPSAAVPTMTSSSGAGTGNHDLYMQLMKMMGPPSPPPSLPSTNDTLLTTPVPTPPPNEPIFVDPFISQPNIPARVPQHSVQPQPQQQSQPQPQPQPQPQLQPQPQPQEQPQPQPQPQPQLPSQMTTPKLLSQPMDMVSSSNSPPSVKTPSIIDFIPPEWGPRMVNMNSLPTGNAAPAPNPGSNSIVGWEHNTVAQTPTRNPLPFGYSPPRAPVPNLASTYLPAQVQSAAMAMARRMGIVQFYEAHGCIDPLMHLPPGTPSRGLVMGCASQQSKNLCQTAGQAAGGPAGISTSLMSMMQPPSYTQLLEKCLSPTAVNRLLMSGFGQGSVGGMDPMTNMMMMMMMMGGGGGGGMLPALAMMNMMGGINGVSHNPSGGNPPQNGAHQVPFGSTLLEAAQNGTNPIGSGQPNNNVDQCMSILPLMMTGGEGLMTAESLEQIVDMRRQMLPYTCQEINAGMMPFRMCCPGKVQSPTYMDLMMTSSQGAA